VGSWERDELTTAKNARLPTLGVDNGQKLLLFVFRASNAEN